MEQLDLAMFFKDIQNLGFVVQGRRILLNGPEGTEWFGCVEDKDGSHADNPDKMLLRVLCTEPEKGPLVDLAKKYGMSVRTMNLEGEPELESQILY